MRALIRSVLFMSLARETALAEICVVLRTVYSFDASMSPGTH